MRAENEVSGVSSDLVGRLLKRGLDKTRSLLRDGIIEIGRGPGASAASVEKIEELLLEADVGVGMTGKVIDALRKNHREALRSGGDALRRALRDILLSKMMLGSSPAPAFPTPLPG